MRILSGNTKITGLFGYPVRHTVSPAFQNAGFEALDLNYVYLPFEVKPEDLESAIEGIKALGLVGVNCTIPHKEAVIQYLDELSEEAEAIGAVNTIHNVNGRLKGYNTDGTGFIQSLNEIDPSGVKGKKVFIMGTGGGGRALAVQFAIEGAAEVALCDKDEPRAEMLTDHIHSKLNFRSARFVPFYRPEIAGSLKKADVFVDATPLGLQEDDPVSINDEWLSPSTLVADLIYKPPETPLLKAAKKRGCRTMNGIGMLLYQGTRAFKIWTDFDAPVDVMRLALREAVYGRKKD